LRVPRCGPHLLSGGRGTARRLLPQAFGKWEGGKRLKKRRGRQALSPPFLAPFFPPPAGCVRRRVAFTGHCRLTPAWAWRVRIWQGWCGDGGGAACAPAGGAWFHPPPLRAPPCPSSLGTPPPFTPLPARPVARRLPVRGRVPLPVVCALLPGPAGARLEVLEGWWSCVLVLRARGGGVRSHVLGCWARGGARPLSLPRPPRAARAFPGCSHAPHSALVFTPHPTPFRRPPLDKEKTKKNGAVVL